MAELCAIHGRGGRRRGCGESRDKLLLLFATTLQAASFKNEMR